MNIALIEDAQPVLGVVHTPVSGATYLATRRGGAFHSADRGAPNPIRTRDYQGGKAVVVASRSHASPALQKVIDVLIEWAIWCAGAVLQLIGAINKQRTLVTLGKVIRFIAGLLVVIGIAYLVMNLLWIARALSAPPPRLASLLTPATGSGRSG